MIAVVSSMMVLQYRFLAVLVALCTQPMRWFGRLSIFLTNIGERTSPDVFKLVFFLLSTPCFQFGHFFFKLACFFNQADCACCASRIFSWSFITAALRRVASSMSFNPFAKSKAVLMAPRPANTSATMAFPPREILLRLTDFACEASIGHFMVRRPRRRDLGDGGTTVIPMSLYGVAGPRSSSDYDWACRYQPACPTFLVVAGGCAAD